ncbi:MAG TPA: UDP-N-acetylmuramoyl-L-alanine--D-glutamate ligase [Aldersonia sp.]
MELTALAGAQVLVTGWGMSGRAVVGPLQDLGAHITLTDARPASRDEVTALGHDFATADDLRGSLDRFALVITSPGFRPEAPVLVAATAAGVPVWGDIEFTWRVDEAARYGPTRRWLVVTGTNGKTTTTSMLASILSAAHLGGVACGNIGLPVLDALRRPEVEVLAVELSSFQLYWAPSVRPAAGVVLNIAEDHLDWHGGMGGYIAAKQRALSGDVAVVGLDDPIAAALPHTAGFRLGPPEHGELGVVDGMLVDRAFVGAGDTAGDTAADTAATLGPVVGISPPGPAGVLDALAAAALARAIGVSPEAVAAGLAAHRVGPHRAEIVHEIGGVGFADDSKATNPHAARSSLLAHPSVVWLAGGQLKGAAVDDLVAEIAPRLRGAVLIGLDADLIAQALARHAPDVPVVTVRSRDDAGVTTEAGVTRVTPDADAVMARAVRTAAGLARPGDVVLLAPAAASLDMFTSYGHRGDSFAAAARGLTGPEIGSDAGTSR